MERRNRPYYLLLVNILIFHTGISTPDICASCKRSDECHLFGEMSREQQQQWIQQFPCESPEKAEDSPLPGFSGVARGDYVCCPGTQVWGIKEQEPPSASETQDNVGGTNKHRYNIPQYLWYQNQPSNTVDPSYYKQPPAFSNDNNNYYRRPQCAPQSLPPTPKSGCCGVDTSHSDGLTDLEDFLHYKAYYSKYGSQYNSPRYSEYSRTKREADDDLEVTFENRIAGGHETDLDQYPWTAYLTIQFFNGVEMKYFGCGGSLISSKFILTAAHCLVNDNDQLKGVDVILAEYDKRTFPRDCVARINLDPICTENLKVTVDQVIIHPNFDAQFLINDIALLRLRDVAPYTRNIRPICLPPINIDSPELSNLPLATAGWGMNMSVRSDVKQFTIIHLVPKSECKPYYTRLTEGHLCASGKNNEDTCKGDSGGPLMMMYKGMYFLVGIVSGKTATAQCGTPIPSLYTNVHPYLDWINYFLK